MSTLEDDVRAAKELGISYGKYKLLTYDPTKAMAAPIKKPQRRRPRKFTDAEAFELWKQGMTDSQIGSALGTSRANIQRWRDQLELPSTSWNYVNTKKYHLTTMQDGTAIIIQNDEV